jgi:predicted Zn-dependent peptidase
MKLLFDVLAEEMHTEIRTKRGLSYAAHAVTSQISIGHGVLAVSTPKPKEVIPVILSILKKLQTKLIPQSQLNEYKKGFATGYLASGETHSSLAGSILGSWYYFGSAVSGYDFPTYLDKVTNKEIKKLANAYFKDMKIGFIGPNSQFDESWFMALP